MKPTRRDVLRHGLVALATTALPIVARAATGPHGLVERVPGVWVPAGCDVRVLARSGQPVAGTAFRWHDAPDGGAVIPVDGGWVYTSNCEYPAIGRGGASALRFDTRGEIVDAYSILSGTAMNCAGGATPWRTWLSCEEHPGGLVWECDPLGRRDAVPRTALGIFKHEAVAVDLDTGALYLTEDEPNGAFYRFTPEARHGDGRDLERGTLEVAEVGSAAGGGGRPVRWNRVPEPLRIPVRAQAAYTPFAGGEGIAWHRGIAYFTTKYDNRVWAYDTRSARITVLYDRATHPDPILAGVDNVAIAPSGEVLVAEDAGDMQLVAIGPGARLRVLVQITGQDRSEIAGPAYDPSGTRLYFSSQRGARGTHDDGITYEVRLG